jgi:hypothetical protein
MMRVRLRDMPDAAELAEMYATPHDHTRWADHRMRVDVTADLATYMLQPGQTVADLSCGDAAIVRRLVTRCQATAILGDLAPGYDLCGPIEETIRQIPHVDLFVCSETLEHVDDPDKVLRAIREKTNLLILSTPDGETDGSRNREHVWGWDAEAVGEMLAAAGFTPATKAWLDVRPAGGEYCFQIVTAT